MLPDPPKIVTATGARARAPTEGGGVRVWWGGRREGCRMDRMGWMILGGWAFLSCRRRDHRTRRHRMAAAPRRPPSHRATAVNRMTARAIFSSILESWPSRTHWREGSAGLISQCARRTSRRRREESCAGPRAQVPTWHGTASIAGVDPPSEGRPLAVATRTVPSDGTASAGLVLRRDGARCGDPTRRHEWRRKEH